MDIIVAVARCRGPGEGRGQKVEKLYTA